jgi:C4-dicarboxylate-binding protein DctP
VRAPLDRAVKEMTEFFNATAAKENDDAIEKIGASGKTEIHVLTEDERKAWINKLMPLHTEMQSRFGKDFIERIYKASGFTPPQS